MFRDSTSPLSPLSSLGEKAFLSLSDIAPCSYRDPGDPCLIDDPVLKDIGKAHGKTAAQVALRWNVQRGVSVVCSPEKKAASISPTFLVGMRHSQVADTKAYPEQFRY